jgi:hypothetical protein
MSSVFPALTSAAVHANQYDLQLPDIPGTEMIQPAPVNECANPDAAWIFCDDFEQDRSAQYFEGKSFVSNNRTAATGWNGSTAVKGAFKQGVVGAGGMKVAFGKTPDPSYVVPVAKSGENLREIYYRMYLKHDEDWTGGGGDKLSRATSLAGGWAQPFTAHLWSGGSTPGNESLSHYLLIDPASGTDEQGNLKATKYNDFDNWRWLGSKKGLSPIFSPDYVGKWYSIEAHIKLNDAGQSNGVFEYWINNVLQVSKTNLNWLGQYDEYGINAVLFENFWNTGSVKDQNRYFDNIVISTQKIDRDKNPESVSGGNSQLGWSAPDGLTEGSELIISTDGTYNFGADGPTMLYRQTLANETASSAMSTNVPIGRGTVTAGPYGTPVVEAVYALPYGKGIAIGTNPSIKAYVQDIQTETQFYEHYYMYWPAAHQDNSLSDLLAAPAAWQIKGIWHYRTEQGYSNSESDVFAGTPLWYYTYWAGGSSTASNSQPTSKMQEGQDGIVNPNNTQQWRSSPLVRQLWVKSGPTAGSAVGSDGMIRLTDTSQGLVTSYDYAEAGYWSDSNATQVGFDRFTIPGYVRGFDFSKNQHVYFADIYQAVGPGAAARVEITDNASYDASKKITVLDVRSWATNKVSASIRKGIFYQESLVGKHLHLFDANNNPIYVGQLGGATPTPTPSPTATPTATPTVNVPGVPRTVKATAGIGQATVTFAAPTSNGGSAITGYEVTASPGNVVITKAASPVTFSGLTNGTAYTFTVKAINEMGSGPASPATNAVTPSVPSFLTGHVKQVEIEDALFKQGILIEAEDIKYQECVCGNTIAIAERGQSWTTANPLGNMIYNWDKPGHLLDWEFNVPEAGNYRIGIRYASNSLDSIRKFQIDGGREDSFHYPRTQGGWSDYAKAVQQTGNGSEDLVYYLEPGVHKIRMTNVTAGLNLDYLVLQKVEDVPVIMSANGAVLQEGAEFDGSVPVTFEAVPEGWAPGSYTVEYLLDGVSFAPGTVHDFREEIGNHTVNAKITRTNGQLLIATKTFKVKDNAHLSGLTVNSQPISDFSPWIDTYTVQVPSDATAIPVIGGIASGYNVTVVQASSVPGTATVVVSDLIAPSNIKTYTIHLQGQSPVSELKSLRLLSLTGTPLNGLVPAFSPSVDQYAIDAGSANGSIQVEATTQDAGASIKVNGLAAVSGSPQGPIGLNEGQNPIAVEVTAQNGTKRTYSIDVTLDRLPTATVTYSVIDPATKSVLATITPSEPVTMTNNGGSNSYRFYFNGSFTFQFVDATGHTGSVTATVANLPSNSTAAPGKPTLSHNNGHDYGLQDGSYNVAMNLYYGQNGRIYKLYENDVVIDTKILADQTPQAQTATTAVSGKPNGTYRYYVEITNAYGTTRSDTITVNVTNAAPSKPVIAQDNWDGDGKYQVSMNLWWGTNGATYRLYENGVLIDTRSLTANTPNAQSAVTIITNRPVGTYVYRGELVNYAGAVSSDSITVVVTH